MNLENGVLQVHIEDIIPNRFQPRLNFDEQGLKELSDSIKEHGIIQPLVLRKLGSKYEIIAGERRYKAAQIAGLQTVPAVVANVDDNTSAEVALVENVQRRDLTAIEEARSYKSLLDKGYLTQEQLAKRMGLSQSAIANKLRLLKLDDEVQQALLDEKISERHARTLLTIEDKNQQKEWLHRIINERLTVRQLDQEIKKVKGIENISTENIEIKEEKPNNNEPKENPETLDIPSATPTDLFPVVETYKDNQKGINIETPSSTKEFMEEVKPISDGKFFNIYDEDDTPEEETPKVENVEPKKIMEIYEDETSPKTENKVQEEQEPVVVAAPIIKDTDLVTEEPIHFNSDNVFFHPPIKDPEEFEVKQPETIDPMDVVKYATQEEFKKETTEKYDLTDALNDIRDLVSKLESKGFKINLEEAALMNEYNININIKEDN